MGRGSWRQMFVVALVAASPFALSSVAGCEVVVVDDLAKRDGAAPPGDGAVSAPIGPEGGELVHPSGASIAVPEGALEEAVTIGLARGDAEAVEATTPDGIELGAIVYSVTPHGTSFERPVTLTFPRDGDQNVLMRAGAGAGSAWEAVSPSYGDDTFVLVTDHLSHFAPSVQLEPGTGFEIVPEVCEHHGFHEPGVGESSVVPFLCGAEPGLFTNGSLHQLAARFPDRLDLEAFAADVGRGIVDVQLSEGSPVHGIEYAWITPSGGERQFIGRIPRDDPLVRCLGCGLPCWDSTTLVLPPGTYTLTVESYVSELCTQTYFFDMICPDELTAETSMRGYAETTFTVSEGTCRQRSATLGPPPDVMCPAAEGAQPPCGPDALCNRTDCISFVGVPSGEHCGEPTSRSLEVVNDCGEQVALRYCLFSTRSGTWDCGVDSTVEPGDGLLGAWTCEGDGRYFYSAMPSDQWLAGACEFGRFPVE